MKLGIRLFFLFNLFTFLNASVVDSINEDSLRTLLLNNEIDINKQNAQGHTILHIASMNGSNRLVEKIIEMGINVNQVDNNHKTALHYALEYQNYDIAKKLINNDSNLSIEDNEGNAPLFTYVKFKKKSNIDIKFDKNMIFLLSK